MPTPNFFSGMTTLQILKAVIGLGSDVQTGSIFPTWSDTVEYCKPDTFWFHEGYLYQSLKESGLQSENGIQVPLSNFEYWKKISYTPLHMGEDELEILNELNTLRISRIGAPQWATSAIAPDDHVFANGDLVYFSDRPELEEKYLSGGFDGMLLAWDATAAQQNANRGMFRPNAASPTGLYMPVDGNAYMQNWVNATNGTPGSFIRAGLPNVTGGTTTYATSQHDSFSGALYGGVTVPAYGVATTNQGGLCQKIGLDISRSNPIYGASTTVTPDTIKQPVIIYLGRADKILSITTKDKDWAATETEIGFGRVSTPADLALPADQITDGPAFLAAGTDAINAFVPTCLIGSVFAHAASSTYVPNGCVPANGGEYTQSQFPSFYTDYLITGKLVTCTYAEFAAQVAATGNCAKFALDTDNQTFKVPLLKDGDSITHAASAAEIGKSVKAGLPNVTGDTGLNTSGIVLTGPFYAGDTNTGISGASVGTIQGINFDLSRANSIYGNSNTVTTEGIRLRHFVVLASAQNNASMFDWSNYMAGLAGKANLNMDNLTQAGTTAIAHYAMPSLRSISYGLVWHAVYTAPADGYFYASGTATNTQQVRLEAYNPADDSLLYSVGGTVMNQTIFGRLLPIKKGMICVPRGDTVVSVFKFIYAEGAY